MENNMLSNAQAVIKVFLAAPGGRGKPFCGPGMINLLEAINETGNVRKACENMGMSYSKGWKLLNNLEKWLSYPVTERRQGGRGGGEARLTEEGIVFLKKYRVFETDCRKAALDLFNKHYTGK